jgi:hypothetical protein
MYKWIRVGGWAQIENVTPRGYKRITYYIIL